MVAEANRFFSAIHLANCVTVLRLLQVRGHRRQWCLAGSEPFCHLLGRHANLAHCRTNCLSRQRRTLRPETRSVEPRGKGTAADWPRRIYRVERDEKPHGIERGRGECGRGLQMVVLKHWRVPIPSRRNMSGGPPVYVHRLALACRMSGQLHKG